MVRLNPKDLHCYFVDVYGSLVSSMGPHEPERSTDLSYTRSASSLYGMARVFGFAGRSLVPQMPSETYVQRYHSYRHGQSDSNNGLNTGNLEYVLDSYTTSGNQGLIAFRIYAQDFMLLPAVVCASVSVTLYRAVAKLALQCNQ